MITSTTVRAELVEALCLDLIGPDNQHAFAQELLPESPSSWYLSGFLVPRTAPLEQRADTTADDDLDTVNDQPAADDGGPPEPAAARRRYLPSTLGLSVLVAAEVKQLEATVEWGDYVYEGEAGDDGSPAEEGEPPAPVEENGEETTATTPARLQGYRRQPRTEAIMLTLPASQEGPTHLEVPNSGGLRLVVTCRAADCAGAGHRLPPGTRSVSVFLLNERKPDERHAYHGYVFQTTLTLATPIAFVPRPDPRSGGDDWDERIGDLHYRDVFEYAVGHGVAAVAFTAADGGCRRVRTTWLPTAEVERVAAAPLQEVELGMEELGALTDGAAATVALTPLVAQYRDWIAVQDRKIAGLEPARATIARDLLQHARQAAGRIEAGIDLLATDPEALAAFRIANRAMAQAARRREAGNSQQDPAAIAPPQWRPFQLAFLLMTLRGVADPFHPDRETVDLLFFPTGGGKTEAYLGLAAFTLVLRRLRFPDIRSAGLSVLMRYTLRLLTLDQLGRAAALICALELERERDPQRLGHWPFEIGLWVGSAATPNRLGGRGYTGPGREYTAYAKLRAFKQSPKSKPSPIPLENCPWCGQRFEPDSFRLTPNDKAPLNLAVYCVNPACDFAGERALPIIGVDEPIYRRLPAFLIATVDKFAALPWTGPTGALFGRVERYDEYGFYGPCDSGPGRPLGSPLPPPDLIIQDELHLISGPLGTVAGLYEAAIDALASRELAGRHLRPKIVASTATVRRAERQIRALFDRDAVEVFPPPGLDRKDSFFARTLPAEAAPARLYLGVAAQGRSLKVVLLRTALALLGAGQVIHEREGGRRNPTNPADPYMTLLGYFNSLRELGGSRRIVEDEVSTRLTRYRRRHRLEPQDTLFADRAIKYEVLELTSRVPTNAVAEAKRRLALSFHDKDRVDVALATNMISVGLDITRLGLMVVLGQPKTCAEYIQATSRVGRHPERPGLVVTLLNIHKPRDRSHYERFGSYHASFYRAVEATSVTPYSPRALDRALAGALVGLCRQGDGMLTPPIGAEDIGQRRAALEAFAHSFAERAARHDPRLDPAEARQLHDRVLRYCCGLLDDWLEIADRLQQQNTRLQYQRWEIGGAKPLLYDFLDPELAEALPVQHRFRAGRSMRDVEPEVELRVCTLNLWGNPL
jgi:hypothetical protein